MQKAADSGFVQVSENHVRAVPTTTQPEGRFDRLISEASTRYGVDVDLVRAVIKAESNFNPRARSPVGAEGLMQLMPALQKDFGITDPFDPRQNVMGGVRYLKKLLDMHGGNVALALASYNAGPGNVARYGGIPPFRETRGYVKKITNWLKDSTNLTTNE